MFCKTINYVDYNGEKHSEDFWFNLSKTECLELEISETGGVTEYVRRIIKARDQKEIVNVFKKFILLSYGEKSPDGKYFIKLDQNGNRLSNLFMQSEAYVELFTELSTNSDAAIEFIKKVIPGADELDLEAKAEEVAKDLKIVE